MNADYSNKPTSFNPIQIDIEQALIDQLLPD